MTKENGLLLLKDAGVNIESIESLNLALLALADVLAAEEKPVPDEIANPQNYNKISREHLGLIRDQARQALGGNLIPPGKEAPGLLPSKAENASQESAITNAQPKDLEREPEETGTNRENAIESFRTILNDLGVKYVAQVVGRSLSDEFWFSVDEARAKQDQKHLEQRVGMLKEDFNEAIDAIKSTADKRKDWENKNLGNLSAISDFSEMEKEMQALQEV